MKPIVTPEWMKLPIKKVAIVGGAPSRRFAPVADRSWEIWGLGTERFKLPRADRWFEMHSEPQLIYFYDKIKGGKFAAHMRFLASLNCPVYMQKPHPSVPNSVAYPLAEVLKDCGRCFSSSVSYMLGLAIHERFQGIGMWGVDMTSKEEYLYQWAGVRYLLALARSRGIHVYLPPGCPITIPPKPVLPVTKVLYGYDWDHPDAWWNKLRRERERKAEERKAEKPKKARAKARRRAGTRAKVRTKARRRAKAEVKVRAKAKLRARARTRVRVKTKVKGKAFTKPRRKRRRIRIRRRSRRR